MDIKQFILDFLSCKISFEEFNAGLNKEVLEYLDEKYVLAHDKGLIPDSSFNDGKTFQALYQRHVKVGLDFWQKSALYRFIYYCMKAEDETLEYKTFYDDLMHLAVKAVPQYLFSEEACIFIEKEIINKLPSDLSKSQKIKIIKEECRKLFYIDGRRYPHWVQSSEWPVRNGKPLRYLRSKRDGELVTYYFEDVDTKEITEIEQFD